MSERYEKAREEYWASLARVSRAMRQFHRWASVLARGRRLGHAPTTREMISADVLARERGAEWAEAVQLVVRAHRELFAAHAENTGREP